MTRVPLALPPAPTFRTRAFLLQAVVLLAVFLSTAWIIGVGLVDDTYIFLRYARNVAAGNGPVFNIGEAVEGYTSPLWMGLLSLLFHVARDPAALAMAASGCLGFASVLFVARNRPFWNALVLASNPAFVFWSFSGMESALAALLLLLAFAELTREVRPRWARAGIWVSLAMLTRPETVVLMPLALLRAAETSVRNRRMMVRKAAALVSPSLIVHVPHLLWRHAFFGSWLPNTYYAKAGVGSSVMLASGGMYALAAITNLLPLGALYLVTTPEHRRDVAAIVVVWLALVVALGGDFFPYYRFLMPVLPIAVFGIGTLRWSRRGNPAVPPGVLRFAGALMVLVNTGLFVNRERLAARAEIQMAEGWAAAGKHLGRTLPEDASIAVLAAGAVPYYSQRPVIDLLGLTDATIGRRGAVHRGAAIGHQRYHTDYVLSRKPEVIFLPESGQSVASAPSAAWPTYPDSQTRYGYALVDLIGRDETRTSYEPRAERLSDGRLLSLLWRKK